MSQDLPTLADILETVKAYLEEVADRVPEKDRYHALCCSYLLGVAAREVSDGAAMTHEMQQALATLVPGEASLETQTRELCAGLRAGRFDARWDEALAGVMRLVVSRVRISKPAHLDPRHQDSAS